ncbi:MAG TPA: HXXEE domain-containing protein [Streptomyces sp.]|nr:HXXEE domain-containing protein [Streptomyces sp.]
MKAHQGERVAEEVGTAVTIGLLAAWALHDTEELALVPGRLRKNLPALRERFPGVPQAVWERLGRLDGREFRLAVALMAAVVAAAAADGRRTGGRSVVYQTALTGFGLHGLLHLAQAVAARGYTPGSATSPVVVIPFTLWARGRLRRAGVLRPTRARDVLYGTAFAGASVVATHALAHRLLASRR